MKKNNNILKIIIIVILFIIIFIAYIIMALKSISSNQLSNKKANLFVSNETTNSEDEEYQENNVIEEKDVYTDSIVIRNLINNNWSRMNKNFSSDYVKDENGNYVFEGYTLYSNDGINVRNIIFNQDYESEVIADLKVGASYEEILNAFKSEPTFINEELNLYGYKTTQVYTFFSDGEISIYPNSNLNNSEFEEILFEYLRGYYDGEQTDFVVELRTNYVDFSASLEGENVVLISEDRQIRIVLNEKFNETEVIIYNGYVKGTLMEENIEMTNIIDENTIDLVELIETERIMSK